MSKIVFVTGGVMSSLGKGIIASSIARLLKDQGVSVNMMKLDPYLNVDPGTMSPLEHGEVYVTYDGGETDLDIGHYERFISQSLSKKSSVSSGQIYQSIIEKERRGDFLGKTVQVIPHVTDEIKQRILENTVGFDVLFVELGGTVGDIESLPFLESIRQLVSEEDTFIIHGAYVPYLKSSEELKTKPLQHSVKELQGLGLYPNMIVTRSEIPLSEAALPKIAQRSGIKCENIIQSVDASSVYTIPLALKAQNADKIVANALNLELTTPDQHQELEKVAKLLDETTGEVTIAIVGKYTKMPDAYKSVIEALKHAGIANHVKVNVELVNSNNLDNNYSNYDGIIVAGGFGNTGIEGKMAAITYARENNVPFLGICLGMQLACLEFARNVCNLDVVHGEFENGNKLIDILADQDLDQLGGTLRLGEYDCHIQPNTLAYDIYKQDHVLERHRHRYEFNNKYRGDLEEHGLVFSGINDDANLVEIIEYPQNDFFIATQYHPELTSRLTDPNPLFVNLVKACIK